MKKTSFLFLLCFIANLSFSQSLSKTRKIQQLLEISSTGKNSMLIFNNMITELKKIYSNVDDKFWEEFGKEIKVEDFNNLKAPIYDKYYSEEDIDQLLLFYNSPVGKKTVEVQPLIVQESMSVGMIFGKQITEKVTAKLKERGYLKE